MALDPRSMFIDLSATQTFGMKNVSIYYFSPIHYVDCDDNGSIRRKTNQPRSRPKSSESRSKLRWRVNPKKLWRGRRKELYEKRPKQMMRRWQKRRRLC